MPKLSQKEHLEILYQDFTKMREEEGRSNHSFFAVADYILHGDIDSFFKRRRIVFDWLYNMEMADIREERETGQEADLPMFSTTRVLLAGLVSQDFDRSKDFAAVMGGRPKAEKREHVYSRTLGYALKATVLQSDDLTERLADFDKTLARKDTGVSYQGHGQILNMLADPSVINVTSALEHIAKYHKRVADTVDAKALCLFGIAMANLAIHRGKTVTIDTEVIPAELLYKG